LHRRWRRDRNGTRGRKAERGAKGRFPGWSDEDFTRVRRHDFDDSGGDVIADGTLLLRAR
jgi:hypothetical protein